MFPFNVIIILVPSLLYWQWWLARQIFADGEEAFS